MFCRTCGATIEPDSRFCGECGSSAAPPPSTSGYNTASTSHHARVERTDPVLGSAQIGLPLAPRAQGKISAATFGLVLVCFLMPFVSVSCQQQKLITLTGLQMVTGTTLQEPQMLGPSRTQKIDPEPLAIVAFLCALGGLVVSIAIGRKHPIVPAILGGAGVVALFSLKSELDGEVLRQSNGLFHLDYEAGFWLAVLLLLAIAIFSAFAHFGKNARGLQ